MNDAGSPPLCMVSGLVTTALRVPVQVKTKSQTAPWATPQAAAQTDTITASTTLAPRQFSQALVVHNLGFNLDPNAEIVGITVTIRRAAPGTSTVVDHLVELLPPGGAPPVASVVSGSMWSSSLTDMTFGGPATLWGTSWTPQMINSPDFGVSLVAVNNGFTAAQAMVDSITVTVTANAPGFTVGPIPATSVTDSIKNGGTIAWSNPGYARLPDMQRASAAMVQGAYSDWLYFTSFTSLGPPPTATLSGIALDVLRRTTGGSGTVVDFVVQLAPSGIPSGASRASGQIWGAAEQLVRYGGVSDMWGIIPPANFLSAGLMDAAIQIRGVMGSTTAEVDSVSMTVFYNTALRALLSDQSMTIGESAPFAAGWTNLAGAMTGGDLLFASTAALTRGHLTELLMTLDHGFAIPSNATVRGVEVVVSRRATPGISVGDRSVRLVIGGAPSGADRSAGTAWLANPGDVTFGATTDLFGLALTPAIVNAPDFGVSLAAVNVAGSMPEVPQVDVVRMKVTYQCP